MFMEDFIIENHEQQRPTLLKNNHKNGSIENTEINLQTLKKG